ncbi:helix-turn-helix domain-containing protein [Streptococcus uberis]|uniref:helix-turn-helix transcriptional regulator n=1 Tax=Streptococcus uberis TaxID=1349 RepID=UPI0027DBE548|nr:helix-turn-helix transcriptional regulator [Streptococcus uberis]MCK1192983.1 helix-turn-helix domain-containing protein [Streptococcus uberis]MCK1244579.1 helix-turn-helix domain-containing protein [Streptococcus uberis]MCK1246863.1 helix-turn-helix domain-containing protein [Streptococcus uberis]
MNRLKELREERSLTQQELAKEIGVHYRTVQNWEKGKQIKPDKARILANFFSVSIGYLLNYVDYNDRDVSSPKLWKEYGKDGNMDLAFGIATVTVGKDTLDSVVATLRSMCDYNQEDFFINGEGKEYDEKGKKEYLDYHQMIVDEKITDLIRALVTLPDGSHLRDVFFTYLTLDGYSRDLLDKILLEVFKKD